MANDLSLRVLAAPFQADMKAFQRRTDRATMWGLREVGRELKRAEKTRVPVYKGPGAVRRLKKKEHGPLQSGPVSGLLKASIGSSRRFKHPAPGMYALVVGPRGGRVNLYKNKIERKYRFAAAAYDEVMPRTGLIMGVGWERAMRSAR